ncbi:MAG: sigma-54 dependent transcriptional regulator [Burkholderiaceae bacterium]|jgi:two-component system C4-dicarboxylate transport response regulator DctD|nr:sigma-54 dependent transcriptional regulator [Burkholderiaceae bacterium]
MNRPAPESPDLRTAEAAAGEPVITVLLVEDDEDVRHGTAQALELAGVAVRTFGSVEAAQHAVRADAPVVILCDVMLPGLHATDWLPRVRQLDPELPFILVTGHGDIAMAVQSMRQGAYDFIEKPAPSERIVEVVQRAIDKRRLVLKLRAMERQLAGRASIESVMLGRSAAMVRLRQSVLALAGTTADVLVYGETGSGKELVARCLHEFSARSDGPFVAINCGGLPETLVENELFGHEAGAFTGAQKSRPGKLEAAHGGTLFLDEIETMSMAVQVKLLRVLQERVVERLGSNRPVPIDIRVVAASKADLKKRSDEGRFRADLYYRIGVAFIELPPLRERRDDVPMLFEHFAAAAALRFGRPLPELSPAQRAELLAHDWPGNLRELGNVAQRFVLALPGERLLGAGAAAAAPSLSAQLETMERALIADALRRHAGDIAGSARDLGLPKQTLYDKLKRLSMNAAEYR